MANSPFWDEYYEEKLLRELTCIAIRNRLGIKRDNKEYMPNYMKGRNNIPKADISMKNRIIARWEELEKTLIEAFVGMELLTLFICVLYLIK